MTAGQDDDAGAGGGGVRENAVGERAACVARHDHVALVQRHVVEWGADERHAIAQARPGVGEHVVEARGRGWKRGVDGDGSRRRVVEQQHDVGEQAVPGCQVHHAAAAEQAPGAPRHFPRLEELLARQDTGTTHGATEPVAQRVAGEPAEVLLGEAGLRAGENMAAYGLRGLRAQVARLRL